MAFQVEAWWSVNYNKYSIRDMQRLPVFHRFVQLHYPFEHATEEVHERFWVEREEVDIFEWTVNSTGRFERFSHDRKLRQYHYETRYTDEESPIIISSWFQQDVEWGTITRKYDEYEVQEGWRLEPPNRMYERFTLEKGIKRGFRAGIYPYKGEFERWMEQIWEIEDERMYTKHWNKQGESGGETINNKGDYVWGENWYSNSAREELKCWHKDGTHQWGHGKGKEREGPKRWDHTWDFDTDDRFEEKVSVKNERDTGYRYWSHKDDWYKQEWEGLKLLEREDRSEQVVSSKFRTRLDNLYVREHNGTLKQQQTLLFLLQFLPDFADRVKDLDKRRADIHAKDRESIDDLFDSIEALRELQDDQEALTQEMLGAFRDELGMVSRYLKFFANSFDNSMLTLKAIGDILEDTKAHDDFVPQIEEWRTLPGPALKKGNKALDLLEELERIKREELTKFKGGIPKEELENAMNLLYQIMVKHDAVSDKIVELTHADDFKKQLDGMEDTFEEIHKTFLDEGDPNKLKEMLTLLLDYQPIHLHLLGRLHGYKKGETDSELQRIDDAVSETKSAPSLKNTRAKVRSGRPTRDTPFQVMDKNFGRLVPALQKLLKAVNAPQEDIDRLSAFASKSVESAEPVEVLMEKSQAILDVVQHADPAVDTHDAALSESDAKFNAYYAKIVESLLPYSEAKEISDVLSGLVGKSEGQSYFGDLVHEKAKALEAMRAVFYGIRVKAMAKIPLLADTLKKFVPLYSEHLKAVNAPEEGVAKLQEAFTKEADPCYPLEVLAEQANALLEEAQAAEPVVADHNEKLKQIDANINQYFEVTFPYYDGIEGAEEEIVAPRKEMISESESTTYLPPLLIRKTEDLLAHYQEVLDYIAALSEQIETITSEMTDTTTLVEELQRTLNDKSELIDQLQKKIKELERRIIILGDDLEAASKYKPLYEERDAIATRLELEVKELHIQNSDLTLDRDHLKEERNRLEGEVKELSDFKIRALDLEQENQRLNGIIKSYDSVLGDKKAQFEQIIGNLNNEIAEKDARIKELLEKIAQLEKELNEKDHGRKRQLMLRVIGSLSNTLKVERTSTFLLWKFTSMAPEDVPPESILETVPECSGFKDETLVESELQSFKDTESPLVEERKQQITTNIVAKHWRLSALKFAKPSRPHEALKFWDNLLNEKFTADKEDLDGGKRPLLFSEFTLEHLLKTLGNRRSAQDLLGSHIPTLYRLTQDGQVYAVLISRLVQLFLGSPAPLEGQVLVVRYRHLFQPLFEGYLKSRTERRLPEKSDLDLAASGGEALLSTVLDTFYGDLSGAQFIVEHWLRHIRPASLSLPKFILYLVYWKLRKAGGNAAAFWSAADPSNTGAASGQAFASAVQGLGLLVSTRLLNEASEKPIKKEVFTEMGSVNLDDDKFVVGKASFLTGVLEAFLARTRRAAVVYTGEFAKKGKAHLAKDDFVATSSALEPGHDAVVFEKIFEEGLTLSGTQDGVDSQAFVRVWLRHLIMPIGHPPVSIPEMHLLYEPHVLEYNLETGIKSTVTTVKTTRTVTTTKKVVIKKS